MGFYSGLIVGFLAGAVTVAWAMYKGMKGFRWMR